MLLPRKFGMRPSVQCAVNIFVCFSLTSAVWISWEYRLLSMVDPALSDILTMVAGYLLQAVGTAAAAHLLRTREDDQYRNLAIGTLVIFFAVTVPALLSHIFAVVLLFGLLMNLLCGMIAGFYLYLPALRAEENRRSLIFGCGYAASTLFVFLLSLLDGSAFLRKNAALPVYLLLTAAAAWLAASLMKKPAATPEKAPAPRIKYSVKSWGLACATIILLSTVKNMGFGFPAADMLAGLPMELSRIFYAAGLIAAGFVNDRSRKLGAISTLAALAIPFVMLAISDDTLPTLIFWGLNYLFFGFFSVFRVILSIDMAAQTGLLYLAPLGLLCGRVGDAAGTALYMMLGAHRVTLIVLTLVMFIVTVFIFFRLYQTLYIPETAQKKSDRATFEIFSINHDLSAREKEVLRLLLTGQSNAQIAESLFVSESTIKYHVHNLLQKTGCTSRRQLITKFNLLLYPEDSN